VTLAHRASEVVVRTTFTDLRRNSAAGLRINIDTDSSRPGPEFALVSVLGDGTDYQLLRMTDHHDPSHPVTDWMLGWRRFTAWMSHA